MSAPREYRLRKEFQIAIAHCLRLPYRSPCERAHGHNLRIIVELRHQAETPTGGCLDPETDMLVDFHALKSVVMRFDHQDLNCPEFFGGGINPTCERLAQVIYLEIREIRTQGTAESPRLIDRLPDVRIRVSVQESEGAEVSYGDPF